MSIFTVNCTRLKNTSKYSVRYPINNFLTNKIKEFSIEDRKWNSSNFSWELKAYILYKLILSFKGSKQIFFDFGDIDNKNVFIKIVEKERKKEEEKINAINELEKNKQIWIEFKKELEVNYQEYSEYVHSFLNNGVVLYPHQIVASLYLNKVRNALLALGMGSGKTLCSIIYAEMNNFNKVFVITPNSLKYNYQNEVHKFTNSKAYIIGKKNKYSIEESKYIIINYDYFNSSNLNKTKIKFNKLNINKIDCLIMDESHRFSTNTSSNTYKAISKIFVDEIFNDSKVSKVFMSGTPAKSRAYQLYGVLHQISPLDFPTKNYFQEYYCGMQYDPTGFGGWVTDISSTKFEELFIKISPFVYRKKTEDIIKDLPEKTIQKIILEMSPNEYDIYDKLENGIVNEFVTKEVAHPLTILNNLRTYTSHLKVNGVRELIDSILESGEKFVVVDFFKDSLKELHKLYPIVSSLHTGDEKDYERNDVIADFQNENGNINLILGTQSTISEGVTLTAASKVGVISTPWTPGEFDQIISRILRIGQKNAVNAYFFVYKDTIDEYVFDLVESKRAELSQVIDGEKYESDINQSIINDLIQLLKNKHK